MQDLWSFREKFEGSLKTQLGRFIWCIWINNLWYLISWSWIWIINYDWRETSTMKMKPMLSWSIRSEKVTEIRERGVINEMKSSRSISPGWAWRSTGLEGPKAPSNPGLKSQEHVRVFQVALVLKNWRGHGEKLWLFCELWEKKRDQRWSSSLSITGKSRIEGVMKRS